MTGSNSWKTKGQWKEIDFNKDTLEKKAKGWDPEDLKGPENKPKEGKKSTII